MDKELSETLSRILSSVKGRKIDASSDADLIAQYSFDLFDLSEVVVAVEEQFGFDVPDTDIGIFSRTSAAVEYISQRLDEIQKWIRNGNE
jgi:acyl carrier protein